MDAPKLSVMTGPDHDRASGVQALLTRGQGHLVEAPVGAEFPTAIDLLAGAAPGRSRRHLTVHLEDVEIVFGPEWLADLHDPTLVISHGYVGPDRRRGDRSLPGYGGAGVHTRRIGRFVSIARIVCITLVLAVPLTLMAARSVLSSSTGTLTPAASTGHHRSAGTTATPGQVARVDAAHQRALARRQLAAGTRGGNGAVSVDRTGVASTVTQQHQARASAAVQARVAAQQQAAQMRAATQAAAAQRRAAVKAAAAQRRAAVKAAAAQRRADAQAVRAQTQAANAGGGGHRSGAAIVALPPAT